jgi:glycosyltransferase involved in cell wall biosynthesis
MVPEKSGVNVGWIVYDLIPLRIPRYFSVDYDAFLKSTLDRARRTDFIVAISESTKQDIVELLDYPEEKICVIYPGTDLAPTPSKPKIDGHVQRPYVHYRGALSHNKNVDGMLRIFARCVHEHGLDIDIILSGKDFCGKTYWTQLIRDLDIAGRVHFAGWVTREKLENILMNAMMLWQFSWYEGFGLPVLEAASRGIPVLYTNRGAVPEILQNPEQEIDPSDEEQAATRAADALRSPEILEAWGNLGLRRAAEFSWDKSGQKLLSWLENHL